MKAFIQISLFISGLLLGQHALAQVGAEGPADEQKLSNAVSPTECQGLLDSFKNRVISYNSDSDSDAEVQAQVLVLMQDAKSQAETMNCAQGINMAVETVDVSNSYKAKIRRRMAAVLQAFLAKVNSNTPQNLRMQGPVAGIGIRG